MGQDKMAHLEILLLVDDKQAYYYPTTHHNCVNAGEAKGAI